MGWNQHPAFSRPYTIKFPAHRSELKITAGKFRLERNIWKKWPGNSGGKETSGKSGWKKRHSSG
jgi:hypothetical protein